MKTPVTITLTELDTPVDELIVMDAIRQVIEHYSLPDDQMRRVLNWTVERYMPPAPTITVAREKRGQR